MKQYPASKTQKTALASLGVEFSSYITYNEAGQLLESKGWTRDGRGQQDEYDENLPAGGNYRNYSEYR